MKRLVDIFLGGAALLLVSPILLLFIVIVWTQDWKSPFYIAPRVGMGGRTFKMIKLRSMVSGADRTGVNSTAVGDPRVTKIGSVIRKLKLDELTQLLNVVRGEMSLVGPRPQTQKAGVDLYTHEEMKLLSVRPGITDFSSIVFSDEGAILAGSENPDLDYNQLIRPWKSRLGLIYIAHSTILLDLKLIILTVVAIVSKSHALNGVVHILTGLKAPTAVIEVARRRCPLVPTVPPGAFVVASSVQINSGAR